MTCCNIVTNTSKTNAKLDECNDEERVEAPMYKPICKLVSLLRYICNTYLTSVIWESSPDLWMSLEISSSGYKENTPVLKKKYEAWLVISKCGEI